MYLAFNHNYNKILKSDWLSAVLISVLIGQWSRTLRVMPVIGHYAPENASACLNGFFFYC